MLTDDNANQVIFDSYSRKAPHHGYDQHTRKLDGMRRLFAEAHIPLGAVPTITVTGSKGKGSTAILAAAMLQAAGERVGLLTSPHFRALRERVRVNGAAIPQDDWVRIISALAPHIHRTDAALPPDEYLSPTGIFLMIALRYFREQGVTAAVLEVGRGGRFDDVSLAHNAVSILTPIMGEHLDKLGPTVNDVAWHKTGIIKPGSTVISAAQRAPVMNIIADVTAAQQGTLYTLGEHIHTARDGQRVTVTLAQPPISRTFSLPTLAAYAAENAALAFAGAVALVPATAESSALPDVLAQTTLPGRCSIIAEGPRVIADGAINRESALRFLDGALAASPAPRVLVTALPADKDAPGLLDALAPHVQTIIVTTVSAGHLTFDGQAAAHAQALHPDVRVLADVREAFAAGIASAGAAGTVWVVGTQSLVRDALDYWDVDTERLIV